MVKVGWIAQRASQLFFLVILLQLPLFRIPCRSGFCSSPLEVTAVQFAASEIVHPMLLKLILYPGAFVRHVFVEGNFPRWQNILQEYNLSRLPPPSSTEKFRIEVIAGSYFAVAGSLVSLLKPGRMSLFGMLLVTWGLMKEGLFDKKVDGEPSPNEVHAQPTLVLALILAVLSIKYDMQKVQKLTQPVVKPLKSSSKAKIK
ncbi:hypothetical protein O6H91_15G077400 [Diphasiastrum complanatum]|uniref:Uncharacterized protein n=1 Tax=Diphasiastrum complanatum TaxID=34168 RepID=A0ACC2BJY1_DIPCM|nr:hypothetical protein O6H91_15G077400 [Diphasiastrum complanatum]